MLSLTERELEAVQHVADGLTDQQVAAAMHIAASTVKNQLERARVKLGARNRAHLVAQAFRAGLLEVPRDA